MPIIMIGPGTGVAPFHAFLQERAAVKAPGRNWLFFGHQRSNYDFFYEDEFKAMKEQGQLTRLTLAWSRDGDQKIYVQDRMREVGRDLWSWLADGADIYVCGNAKRMAKDVELALVDVVAQHGARTPEEVAAFVGDLKKKRSLSAGRLLMQATCTHAAPMTPWAVRRRRRHSPWLAGVWNVLTAKFSEMKVTSYFQRLIAGGQNGLLSMGSFRLFRSRPMTDFATSTISAGSVPRRADNVEFSPWISEDWLSLIVGLLIFGLALPGIANVDLLGWAVTTSVWTDLGKALAPVAKSYAALGGVGAAVATYVALLAIMSVTVFALKSDLKRFALAFTAVFWIAYGSWVLGSYANFAAVTPADLQKFGVSWSLRLTNEGGYIFALLAGLIIANFFPRFAESIKAAVRPELYIKIAIVILGGVIAATAAGRLNLASSLLLRGVAAIVEAYLIYWAVVYFVARKWFGFNREWAAPLASGISICGVAASIATGSAIRAKPAIPVLVSSLVVIFAVVEVLILPFLAQTFLWREPLVAGAWIGLAVKTDGAAIAGGGITEALILAKNAAEGIKYQPGWILATTATVKIFIDIFIGVWAFILGYIWTNHINPTAKDKAKPSEIWQRFPKFILGFLATSLLGLYLVLGAPSDIATKVPTAMGEANTFRVIFFVLTFFSIGVLSNFRTLWQEGIGRLAAVYFISLFGFVIWVGLLISWLFFNGLHPPLAS